MPAFVQQTGTAGSEKIQWAGLGPQTPGANNPSIASGAGMMRSEFPENAQPFDRHAERLGEILLGEPQKVSHTTPQLL